MAEEKPKLTLPKLPSLPTEEEVYEKELGAAQWYVRRKTLIKNILIVVLLAFNFLLISYIVYALIDNFVIKSDQYSHLLADLAMPNSDYQQLRQSNLPQPIQVKDINTFVNRSNYDILAQINNPNNLWWASFEYQFEINNNLTPVKKGFILPAETKYLPELAVPNGNLVSKLNIININWHKEINFTSKYQERFNFSINEVNYTPASQLELGEEIAVNRVEFKATNLSAYNFRQLRFLVLLKQGTQIEAVNQIVIENFLSGESRDLVVSFFQQLGNISNVEIIAQANILDEQIFLEF